VPHSPCLVIAFVVAQMWFVSGTFVATGDVTPFVEDLMASGGSLWGHAITGAGSQRSGRQPGRRRSRSCA
jgi:hypothetical protein